MKRVLLSTLALNLLLAGALATDRPLRVTVPQLLATPAKFVGKRVDVTGWYVALNEDSQLYRSKDAARGSLDDSVWLEPDVWDPRSHPHRKPGVAAGRNVENCAVRVIGTFHYQPKPNLGKGVPYARRYQGFGSYRLNKRAIDHLTYFERLP